MPTYQYKCQDCGKTFDYFQKMSDEPLKTCVLCKKRGNLKRLIGTGAGIIFKGSGFYETDYKKKSNKGSAEKKENASSNSKDEKSNSVKTETKKNDRK